MHITYFIIKTDPNHPAHHGLRRNPSPYVLTFRPTGGEFLEYVGHARVYSRANGAIRVALDPLYGSSGGLGTDADETIHIVSSLGRPVELGEDQADAAFGHDILGRLIAEQFAVSEDGTLYQVGSPWSYAPVDIRHVPFDKECGFIQQDDYEGPALGSFDTD